MSSKAGLIYCKHNTVNEFDYPSDISRWHKVRHVPSFLIFSEGALIDKLVLPDSRAGAHGPSSQVRTYAAASRLCHACGLKTVMMISVTCPEERMRLSAMVFCNMRSREYPASA